jgi:hypothetical protein
MRRRRDDFVDVVVDVPNKFYFGGGGKNGLALV